MKEFKYKLKDKNGIHARPAGMLVREASKFKSQITLSKGERHADAKRLFAVMGLAAKKDDEIVVTIEGPDEKEASGVLQAFLMANM